jgi:hypothetical protein
MPSSDDVSVAELARSVREAFIRLEGFATRLESGQFVRTDLFTVSEKAREAQLRQIETDVDSKASKSELANLTSRVSQLEDDRKWLVRLILGVVILAVIGLVVVTGGSAP